MGKKRLGLGEVREKVWDDFLQGLLTFSPLKYKEKRKSKTENAPSKAAS